jgi:hypothetical protein
MSKVKFIVTNNKEQPAFEIPMMPEYIPLEGDEITIQGLNGMFRVKSRAIDYKEFKEDIVKKLNPKTTKSYIITHYDPIYTIYLEDTDKLNFN